MYFPISVLIISISTLAVLTALFNLIYHRSDSDTQEGNFAIGKMSGGEIGGEATLGGIVNEIYCNNSSKKESFSADSKTNQETLKISIKNGDKEASVDMSSEQKITVEQIKAAAKCLTELFEVIIIEIEEGSIKFILQGSEQELINVVASFKSGNLVERFKHQFNIELENAELIDSVGSKDYTKNQSQNQKLLAFTITGNVNETDMNILKAELIARSDEEKVIKYDAIFRSNFFGLTRRNIIAIFALSKFVIPSFVIILSFAILSIINFDKLSLGTQSLLAIVENLIANILVFITTFFSVITEVTKAIFIVFLYALVEIFYFPEEVGRMIFSKEFLHFLPILILLNLGVFYFYMLKEKS